MHDMGYDVADYKGVDPVFGTLDDFDRLVAAARERGLRVLLDLVPCHTSIEHPWFARAPRLVHLARSEPNNWMSAFGGSAWSKLDGRCYLHSFYPEQPDLDWRNPDVIAAMQDVLAFWVDRGAAGYRVDAIDRLLKDAELRDDPPASEPFGLPLRGEEAKLALTNSRNAPDTRAALARIREAVGDSVLIGEVYLPSAKWQPYLEHLDAAFAFELLHATWEAARLRARDRGDHAAAGRGVGALEPRLRAPRDALRGRERARRGDDAADAAGPAFLYQGDEIGLGRRAGGRARLRPRRARPLPPSDAVGRVADGRIHDGGAVAAAVDPERTNVEAQRDDPRSTLSLVRDLLTMQALLGDGMELLDAAPGRARLPPRRPHRRRSTRPPRSGPRRAPARWSWRRGPGRYPRRGAGPAFRRDNRGIVRPRKGGRTWQMADITLENVTKRFPDGYEAVRDMSLDIKDGEFMILVGPSGCGKITALRMIAGLEDITDGELKIGGNVVNELSPKDRDIAMVFQNYALYPHMSVRDNMGFALRLAADATRRTSTSEVEEAARILDLEPHLDRKPSQLSGGQRQRVAMGRAIVRDPSAFLMDEPLSNLDAKLRVQMRTEVSRLQQRLGTTTIYVTHDQTEALTLGDRVAVMRSGVLQQVGQPMELYNQPGEPVRGGIHRVAGHELHAGERRRRHREAARSATSGCPTSCTTACATPTAAS